MCFKVPNKRVTRQTKAASGTNSELNESALAQYTKNMTGAVGVKTRPAQSPKELVCSNQSDELPYNVDLNP